jgi:asparagine synthase (glutamine-hydrolysing)
MCGIAGIIADRPDPAALDLMLALIDHRGPDDLGTYLDESAALGTTRLSIIDLEGGHQPMRHEDTGVVLAFNGEVFNYKEVREDLARGGFRFRTRSDTEVILALYLEYGVDFPEHLNGQFAVSIWDPRERKLVLASIRDLSLYYHDHRGVCSDPR